ncbi:glycoside hydrolase superfamily [Xylaria nigripes]|nr:glycoside hydrolase superfamily [Xylaria nigripes]
MHTATLLAVLVSAASAAKLGFNYGSTFTTGAAKMQSDFESEFTLAANLKDAKGFTSARLYTMVQAGTASDPITAIPAAMKTNTSLLLGLWASAGDVAFANEILALKAAIKTYGSRLGNIVDGISVGSEDLYRSSPQGIAVGSGPGASTDVILKYVDQVKKAIAGTPLQGAPVGHVDTWTAWDDRSSAPLVQVLDWLGMDAYPYFQNTMPNGIGLSKSLFQDALGRTKAAAGNRPVWVTETGHPVSGKPSGDSVASVENAEMYWKTVGCPMFGEMNVWWYTLQDAAPATPDPSFGIIASGSTTPLFDLSCKGGDIASPPSSNTSTLPGVYTSKPTDTTGTPSKSGGTKPTSLPGDSSSNAPSTQTSLSGSASSRPASTAVTSGPKPSAPTASTSAPLAGIASHPQYSSLGAAFIALMGAILFF